MKAFLFIIGFCCALATSQAQNITKVTTLVVHPKTVSNGDGGLLYGNATNSLSIAAGEAARVSTTQHVSMGFDESNYADFLFIRDGWYWTAANGTVVEGPVTFVIELTADADSSARLTLERWKVSRR